MEFCSIYLGQGGGKLCFEKWVWVSRVCPIPNLASSRTYYFFTTEFFVCRFASEIWLIWSCQFFLRCWGLCCNRSFWGWILGGDGTCNFVFMFGLPFHILVEANIARLMCKFRFPMWIVYEKWFEFFGLRRCLVLGIGGQERRTESIKCFWDWVFCE